MFKYLLIIIGIIGTILSTSCEKKEKDMKDGVFYFKSWSGYNIPYQPAEPVAEDEALTLDTYYVGKYSKGGLVSFEKIHNNQRVWIDEYEYWDETKVIKKRKMQKADGTVTEQEFDRKGKIIK